ncbi:hypothetical protein V8C42DRAFT_321087 [Trichoderma barbatum]
MLVCWLAVHRLRLVVMAQWPPPAQKGGVEACSTTTTTDSCPVRSCRVTRSRCVSGALSGISAHHWWTLASRPHSDSRRRSLVDRPFSVRELQFCGRKGGMGTAAVGTPRALHCNTQHSTAYVGFA